MGDRQIKIPCYADDAVLIVGSEDDGYCTNSTKRFKMNIFVITTKTMNTSKKLLR